MLTSRRAFPSAFFQADYVPTHFGGEWQNNFRLSTAAEPEFKRAIELNPNYATAHQWYALYLAVRGQRDEAKREMQQAVELDPLSPNINADLGQICYFAHEYDQAIAHLDSWEHV